MVEYVRKHITPGFGRPGKKLYSVDAVVLHWSANTNPGSGALWHRDWAETFREYKVSSHLYIDDKAIVETVPLDEWAYHVGNTTKEECNRRYGPYLNSHTWSVEWCVNRDANGALTYRNVVGTCAMLLREANLSSEALIRHFDVTGKVCPAFFCDDKYAKQMGFENALIAWKTFRRDIRLGLNLAEVLQAWKR